MSQYFEIWYNMCKLMVYQTPNLLQVVGLVVSITADTVPDDGSGYPAINLITNLSTRTANVNFSPMIDIN